MICCVHGYVCMCVYLVGISTINSSPEGQSFSLYTMGSPSLDLGRSEWAQITPVDQGSEHHALYRTLSIPLDRYTDTHQVGSNSNTGDRRTHDT